MEAMWARPLTLAFKSLSCPTDGLQNDLAPMSLSAKPSDRCPLDTIPLHRLAVALCPWSLARPRDKRTWTPVRARSWGRGTRRWGVR